MLTISSAHPFSYFNSIKVRLKLTNRQGEVKSINYFNSIKVRLKHFNFLTCVSSDTFQFHKGTIKTCRTCEFRGLDTTFQFHKGTIKTFAT